MLKIAFIHPDLGIGGAERLVTSHHDPNHCFEDTKDGRLKVHNIVPPFPHPINGKFHILFAHLLPEPHLFVEQLSTCIPLLRVIGRTRVVFYCHFPYKLLANGEFIKDPISRAQRNMLKGGLLKRIYRYPMDWLEEITTRQADVILANSNSSGRSIRRTAEVVYPATQDSSNDPDVAAILSNRPTLISLDRFEKKNNVALAVEAFARIRAQEPDSTNLRLVLGGGYDPRLEDNMLTLYSLIDLVFKKHTLSNNVITPFSPKAVKIPLLNTTLENPAMLFVLNFTTAQQTALLMSPSTIGLLYTPANEHFRIVPVEGDDFGGPVKSIVDEPAEKCTGWLRAPNPEIWTEALCQIVDLGEEEEKSKIRERAKKRAREISGMEALASGIENALKEAVDMGQVQSRVTLWLVVLAAIMCLLFASRWA
ncbi:glycosyltransferase family 4 protein [Lentinula guzmanii]|uniref:Alpha-1,3/1,6-mannosyltransferase ALG2 n=1 Tax=Lentinula guzmanii TaxID=2804957 RepID=A0AA38J692_9AGAR|nr:glycosyltransferase family 4 protein [Lentinula guzmanii]